MLPEITPPRRARAVMQGLWLGSKLTVMEQLSIASFVAHGHAYHLYAYEDLANVPAGAVLTDASRVLPREWMFRDSRGTVSGFSNFFRYKLLLEKGGWWVDADVVCLRPFDFEREYVFLTEPDSRIGSAVIHVPKGTELMARCWGTCERLDRSAIEWGATGPLLLGELIQELQLTQHAAEPTVFCPIDWRDWSRVLEPGVRWQFDPVTYAVHLWNEMWRLEETSKEATYPADCLYETLKRRYLT